MTAQRRDPRADRLKRRVPGALRERFTIEVAADRGGLPDMPTAPVATAPTIKIDDPAYLVAVVVDAPDGLLTPVDRQVIGAGRVLADAGGGAVLLLSTQLSDDPGAAGADRIVPLHQDDAPARAGEVAAIIAALEPRHIIFAETPDGGDLARRVAVSLGETLFGDVEMLTPKQMVRPARAGRVEQRSEPGRLIAIAADIQAPYGGPPREARPTLQAGIGAATSTNWQACDLAGDPGSLKLGEADFVVAAGNGVTDFATFHQLVEALGATPGASRVLCDAGLMPRDRQVGASGTVLSGTCYLALGIAGAPQHLEGVARVEHVVAVNTDLHAAMIARAGLAVVDDAQAIMPALLAQLAERGR
jgi:electron transfer flavoprotein alpha subunit